MKRILCLLTVLSLLFSVSVLPIHASSLSNARWINTHDVVIAHKYYYGDASCCVSITGYSNAVVTNVDISFDQVTGAGLINLATWNDLSSGEEFLFLEMVPNVEVDCIYRLSFTADIVRNGVVETISDYLDLFYTEDM